MVRVLQDRYGMRPRNSGESRAEVSAEPHDVEEPEQAAFRWE
jgi:hypothetical protein